MLTGFKEQTDELSPEEISLSRVAWAVMNRSFKSGQPITNTEISNAIKQATGKQVASSRIRKMINWMHTSGHLPGLIASSNGYSLAKNVKELNEYANSLKGRITAIQQRLNAVKRDMNNYGQEQMSFNDELLNSN